MLFIFLILIFCLFFYTVFQKNKKNAIEDYPKMKPILEKYSGDLNRVIRYSKADKVRSPVLTIKILKDLGFIKIENSEIKIINQLPVSLQK